MISSKRPSADLRACGTLSSSLPNDHGERGLHLASSAAGDPRTPQVAIPRAPNGRAQCLAGPEPTDVADQRELGLLLRQGSPADAHCLNRQAAEIGRLNSHHSLPLAAFGGASEGQGQETQIRPAAPTAATQTSTSHRKRRPVRTTSKRGHLPRSTSRHTVHHVQATNQGRAGCVCTSFSILCQRRRATVTHALQPCPSRH